MSFCQNWVADLAKLYQIIMFHESLGRISWIQDWNKRWVVKVGSVWCHRWTIFGDVIFWFLVDFFRGYYITHPNNAFWRVNPQKWAYICIVWYSQNRFHLMTPVFCCLPKWVPWHEKSLLRSTQLGREIYSRPGPKTTARVTGSGLWCWLKQPVHVSGCCIEKPETAVSHAWRITSQNLGLCKFYTTHSPRPSSRGNKKHPTNSLNFSCRFLRIPTTI